MDQAAVLRELKVNLGLPWEKLAQRLSLTKQRVLDLVGLLDLPDEIKEDIRKKKLTERHGRALRQLLDKAEILREVFNFIKDKKLTGEQTQELVQGIKSEPRFTIEDLFSRIKNVKKQVLSKSDYNNIALITKRGEIFVRQIKKINLNRLTDKERKLISNFIELLVKEFSVLLIKLNKSKG